jgi:hypothetical protein
MKKPNALVDLLAELQGEGVRSDVEVVRSSKAVIFPNDDAAEHDDGIELSAGECRILFASPATIERLAEALDSKDATMALFDLEIPGESLEALERNFVAVDEG